MLGRDSGLPLNTRDIVGISGNVLNDYLVNEDILKITSMASSSRGLKTTFTEHTMTPGLKMRLELQDLSNSRDILHCGDGISRHRGGTYSHGGLMEYPRFPISELHLCKIPRLHGISELEGQLQD